MRQVVLPKDNEQDLHDLPDSVREEMKFVFAENVEENSRLSCQIKVSDALDGLVVRMPESQH